MKTARGHLENKLNHIFTISLCIIWCYYILHLNLVYGNMENFNNII